MLIATLSLDKKIINEIKAQAVKIAKELNIIGLMNVQFAVIENEIFIIEVNPRASRTVPFISKAIGISLVKDATKAMIGKSLPDNDYYESLSPELSFVKEAVMPFDKFPLVDPILGPEMKSTGEVMGIGKTLGKHMLKPSSQQRKILSLLEKSL